MLGKFSADDNLKYFSYSKNKVWYFMQIVSSGDNLHEMSNFIFWKKKKKKINKKKRKIVTICPLLNLSEQR